MPDQFSVPPPPPDAPLEVVIRTRASDLALLAKSGGSTAGLSGASITIGKAGEGAALPAPRGKGSQTLVWTVVFVVGAVVLFFVGYYLIPLVGSGVKRQAPGAAKTAAQKESAPSGASSSAPAAKPAEPAFFGHASFFREAPDAVKEFDPYHTISGPIDRASVVATIDLLTKSTGAAGALFELSTKSAEGRPLTWGEFVGLMNASALDEDIIRDSFARDFTVFVWRDVGGAWPGFIFKLKEGLAPLLVQKQMFSIETPAENFRNLFPVPPASSTRGFSDVQISGQPARSLAFQKPAVTFTYGWFFKNYFIMSTSEEGLKQALSRL